MVWYSHLSKNFPQFVLIHTGKGVGIVNKAEVDFFFLELSCFFDDPMDVGNLISGSCAFCKSSLNIWKFMVHVLLKPGLENFKHVLVLRPFPGWAAAAIAPVIRPSAVGSPRFPSVSRRVGK